MADRKKNLIKSVPKSKLKESLRSRIEFFAFVIPVAFIAASVGGAVLAILSLKLRGIGLGIARQESLECIVYIFLLRLSKRSLG